MDRRSWLWRRKSSEKSPGETESSGSISSHSERCFDEQASAAHSSQSLEVTSKAVLADEDVSDRVRTLSEKLSAALLNISAKEELVKQHARVAEEAVSGWEKAENEVSVLKKQLESAKERNSSLENRVSHLDGALKECLRQLRQSREEQEQRIDEAIMERTRESELVNSDLRPKLEAAQRENSILKSELRSRVEELEVRSIELDLSTKAAETASKQNLESIKKVAKLESEIRQLKAMARKVVSASSFCAESFTDSQSDAGERILAFENSGQNEFDPWTSNLVKGLESLRNVKNIGKNIMVSSLQVDLMDDFLEMERLAGLPDAKAGSSRTEAGAVPEQFTENRHKSELDAMINRTADLEEEIEKKEAEKAELEAALRQLHEQLHKAEICLEQAEARLTELETRLSEAEELKGAAEENLEVTESKLRGMATEIESLHTKVKLLEDELRSEQAEKLEKDARLRTLEEEISSMKEEAELQQAADSHDEMKLKQARELEVAASKFAECQKTIASLGQKLKSLASLEDFLVDSDIIPGLMDEEDPQHPENSYGPDRSDHPSMTSEKRESGYPTDNFSTLSQKARERGGTNASRSRNGRGKLSTQGNKVGT